MKKLKKSQLYLMTTSNAAVRAAREIPTVSTTLDRTSGKTRVSTSGPLPFLFIDQFAQERHCENFSEQRKLDPVQTQIVELKNIQWGCGCAKEDLSLLFPNPCCLESRSHMLCKCITPSTDLCSFSRTGITLDLQVWFRNSAFRRAVYHCEPRGSKMASKV